MLGCNRNGKPECTTATTRKVLTAGTSIKVGPRPSQKRCGPGGKPSGPNIAPFNSGSSCVSHPSPTAPLAVWGTGAVDEAWKTRRHCRLVRGGDGIRIVGATVGSNIAPFNFGPSVADVRSTGGTVRTEHRPNQFRGPSCDSRRFDRCRGGGRTAYQEHHQKQTPGETKTDHLVINGTALTGLSTLCPRRRSPVNQVAVDKGWVTPSTTSADRRF